MTAAWIVLVAVVSETVNDIIGLFFFFVNAVNGISWHPTASLGDTSRCLMYMMMYDDIN